MAYIMQPSNYTANRILNKEFGAAAYTPPATLWLRAFSTILTAAGAGSEISVSGYAAKDFDNNTTTFPTTTTRAKASAIIIETDVFLADCTILALGLWDDDVAGNLLYYANFASTPLNILNGQTIKLNAGDLTLVIP